MNNTIRSLIEDNIRAIRRVDDIIDNDLEEPFHTFVPLSANFVNHKEGIHFLLIDKLIEINKDIEAVIILYFV